MGWCRPVPGARRMRGWESEQAMTDRRVLLLAHPGRAQAREVACQLVDALSGHGIQVRLLPEEAAALGLDDNPHVHLAGEGTRAPSVSWSW